MAAYTSYAEPHHARPADNYVDGIGVNTHLTSPAYDASFDKIVKPALKDIGIRYIRDGFFGGAAFEGRIRELGLLGIRASLITSPQSLLDLAGSLGRMSPGPIAVEGPNEPYLWPITFQGVTGNANLKPFQIALWNGIKGDPATRGILVLPFGGDNFKHYLSVGNLEAWCDRGNFHHYTSTTGELPGGYATPPTDGLYIGRGGYRDSSLLALVRKITPAKPLWMSESGYSTYQGLSSGWDPGVSERAAGRYFPRITLELFNNNVEKFFLYELLDGSSNRNGLELNFGMVRKDGSLKPHGRVLKNMIGLLKDPGPPFIPSTLDYHLTSPVSVKDDSDSKTAEIHQTLLQKRDGRFYLILWYEAKSYDYLKNADIQVPDVPVTLTLGSVFAKVNLYRPLDSAGMMSSQPQRNVLTPITLKVPDHPLVVELVPEGFTTSLAEGRVKAPEGKSEGFRSRAGMPGMSGRSRGADGRERRNGRFFNP